MRRSRLVLKSSPEQNVLSEKADTLPLAVFMRAFREEHDHMGGCKGPTVEAPTSSPRAGSGNLGFAPTSGRRLRRGRGMWTPRSSGCRAFPTSIDLPAHCPIISSFQLLPQRPRRLSPHPFRHPPSFIKSPSLCIIFKPLSARSLAAGLAPRALACDAAQRGGRYWRSIAYSEASQGGAQNLAAHF